MWLEPVYLSTHVCVRKRETERAHNMCTFVWSEFKGRVNNLHLASSDSTIK